MSTCESGNYPLKQAIFKQLPDIYKFDIKLRGLPMNPIETNLQYIRQCAEVNATKIIEVTRHHNDFEEYQAQLIYELVRALDLKPFDEAKACFRTYSSMIIRRAASRIIKRHFSRKNQLIVLNPSSERQYNYYGGTRK